MILRFAHLEQWLLNFMYFFTGCFVCFILQSQFSFSTVMAAGLTGFLGSFIPETKKIASVHIHAMIYAGAFVAMGSKIVEAGPVQLIVVSILGSGIYLFLTPHFKGLGGKLGLIAFISSLLGVLIRLCL